MWHKRSKVIIILNQYIYHLFLNLVQCTQPQSRGRLLTSQLSRWWWSTPSVRRVSHRRLLNKPAVLYRSIESRLEGKSVIGKGAHSTGITAALGGLSSKVHSRTCESFRSGPRLESVHQEPPYTDTFRKGAATVAQLQWTISEDLFFWAFCFFLSQIRWAERGMKRSNDQPWDKLLGAFLIHVIIITWPPRPPKDHILPSAPEAALEFHVENDTVSGAADRGGQY